jgi:putative endonuclease
MAKNNEIGQEGERFALQHLINHGYTILRQNWRFSKAEIDIICKKDDHLVFVEVKTRSYTYYGQPAESVTEKKERLMMDAANVFMAEIQYEWKFRFDIISIIISPDGNHRIEHVEDAFFPGW